MNKTSFFTYLFVLPCFAVLAGGGLLKIPNHQVRFDQFTQLTSDLQPIREKRLVSVESFLEMARDKNTIILDTRSKWAYEQIHIEGARHLNFSDFTGKKLNDVIPDKNTRILIYCNNNFIADQPDVEVPALSLKSPALALNIPTFINLWGYGYKNIYELTDLLPLSDAGVPLAGKKATELRASSS